LKVVALKTILYSGGGRAKIYEKGDVFEIDDVSYYVRKERGEIDDVHELTENEIINVDEGLPPLDVDEKTARKKKNVTDI